VRTSPWENSRPDRLRSLWPPPASSGRCSGLDPASTIDQLFLLRDFTCNRGLDRHRSGFRDLDHRHRAFGQLWPSRVVSTLCCCIQIRLGIRAGLCHPARAVLGGGGHWAMLFAAPARTVELIPARMAQLDETAITGILGQFGWRDTAACRVGKTAVVLDVGLVDPCDGHMHWETSLCDHRLALFRAVDTPSPTRAVSEPRAIGGRSACLGLKVVSGPLFPFPRLRTYWAHCGCCCGLWTVLHVSTTEGLPEFNSGRPCRRKPVSGPSIWARENQRPFNYGPSAARSVLYFLIVALCGPWVFTKGFQGGGGPPQKKRGRFGEMDPKGRCFGPRF